MNGKLFLIVGPSGSGKGTVISNLKKQYPGFVYPLSYTTRDPREGEHEGEVYRFISEEEFKELIENDELLEYAVVHGTEYYGAKKSDILDPLESGSTIVREVDIQGFHTYSKIIPRENLVSIFMKVVDQEDLKNRILRRGEMTEDELNRRLKSSLNEIAQADQCDYQVKNEWGKINECVLAVEKIILKEIKDLY